MQDERQKEGNVKEEQEEEKKEEVGDPFTFNINLMKQFYSALCIVQKNVALNRCVRRSKRATTVILKDTNSNHVIEFRLNV